MYWLYRRCDLIAILENIYLFKKTDSFCSSLFHNVAETSSTFWLLCEYKRVNKSRSSFKSSIYERDNIYICA